MIPTSCAWARMGLRRQPQECIAGNPPSLIRARLQTLRSQITRRHHASRSPVAQKAPESANTIPGANWLWLEPIYEPFRAYGRVQQRKPYTTQFISSLVIYFVGDMVAQSIAEPTAKETVSCEAEEKGWVQEWSDNRDWHRTGRSLLIGGLSSIPAYRWFLWLGGSFNFGSKILSLTTKVAVNQAVFTPIFNSYFFGMHSLLSGATLPEVVERIKNTVPTSWINSCKIWPAITAFMFTYIPIQYRSIFGGVIAIGWQTYLSLLNQRAAKKEAERGAEYSALGEVKAGLRDEEREQVQERQKCSA